MEIKICGLTRECDAELALSLGATYLGFVFYKGSRRCADLEVARRCSGFKVGVFVSPSRDELLRAVDMAGLSAVQIHGDMVSGCDVRIFRALSSGEPDIAAERYVADNAIPGSGVPGDWQWAARLAARFPVLLAGGLHAQNVAEAINMVHPIGVDVAGGVESAPGIKSKEKMKAFFKAIEERI